MEPRQRFPWQLVIGAVYAALILSTLLLVKAPWNLVVSAVILFKALVFLMVIRRAQSIGVGLEPRQEPPKE